MSSEALDLDKLVAQLRELDDDELVECVVDDLVKLGERDPSLTVRLEELLGDPDGAVVRGAILALGKLSGGRVSRRLRNFVRRGRGRLCMAALEALAALGDVEAFGDVRALLQGEHGDSLLVRRAARAGRRAASYANS